MGTKKSLSLLQSTRAKNIWTLLQGKGLWVQVIGEKYIFPTTLEDWERNPDK
jgi:hypothetical protein